MALKSDDARPTWFAMAAASWLLLGTLLLVLMAAWNGGPFPVAVPRQLLPLLGFFLILGFVYVMPIYLLSQDRKFRRARQEPSGYLGYAGACGSMILLWALIFMI